MHRQAILAGHLDLFDFALPTVTAGEPSQTPPEGASGDGEGVFAGLVSVQESPSRGADGFQLILAGMDEDVPFLTFQVSLAHHLIAVCVVT